MLKHWEGLGYYRRGRQLHAAAKRDRGRAWRRVSAGRWTGAPPLPGIGRYTAGAIASIAFGLPEPIVEANSRRVIARLAGYAGHSPAPRAMGRSGRSPRGSCRRQAGLFNQALMDLGAMVCRPAAPSCTACPLARHCVALRDGRTDELPRLATPKPSVAIEEVALLVVHDGQLLVVQRGEAEWWAGLWDVPRAAGPLGPLRRSAARDGRLLGEVRYGVTHHRVRVDVVQLPTEAAAAARATVADGSRSPASALGVALASEPAATAWVSLSGLATLAMPSPARRILELLTSPLSASPGEHISSSSISA